MDEKEQPMKTESDGKHPASHYLVVEDPEQVSTWHLRVRDVNGDVDHNLMGAAWAALHQGYRGNVYEGPGKQEAIAKLKRLYEQEDMDLPGKSDDGPEEAKYGRAISGRNAERLIGAVTTIADVLEAAGYDIPGYDKHPAPIEPPEPEEETGKSADVGAETSDTAPAAEEAQDANQDQHDEKRAGPSDEAPTPDEGAGPPESETPTQQDIALARIRIARAQLDLLEV